MTTTAPPRTFTSHEVCDLAGLSYRRLDYAIRRDVLNPARTHDPEPGWYAHGAGNARVWSEAEAIKAVELGRMLRLGIGWSKAAELLAEGRTAALIKIPLPETLP
jgi:hypothetical protein